MALTQVTGPYPIFTDLDGTPLDDGYLFIGAINDDPETNPIQVYWDSNLTIPATQPIRTNNGYAWRNGTPGLLYTGGEFSITIRNKRNEFVLYSPVGYGFDPAAVSASVVKNDFVGDGVEVNFTLSSAPSTQLATNVFINGVYQEKDSYTLAGNVITFSVAPPLSSSIEIMTNETGVINSGNATAISYTLTAPGAVQQTVQTKLEQYVSVKDFGASSSTTAAANLTAFQDAVDAVPVGGSLLIPADASFYTIDTSGGLSTVIQINKRMEIVFEGDVKASSSAIQANPTYIFNVTADNVTFTGAGGKIIGDGTTNSVNTGTDATFPGLVYVTGDNFTMAGCVIDTPPKVGVMLYNCVGAKLLGNTFTGGPTTYTDTAYFGVRAFDGSAHNISDNSFLPDGSGGMYVSAIFFNGTVSSIVDSNICVYPYEKLIYCVGDKNIVSNNQVIGNPNNIPGSSPVVKGTITSVYRFDGDNNICVGNFSDYCAAGATCLNSKGNVIKENTFLRCGQLGVVVFETSGYAGGISGTVVADNYITFDGGMGFSLGSGGIKIDASQSAASKIVVKNNYIDAFSNAAGAAIYIVGTSGTKITKSNISGNVIASSVNGILANYVEQTTITQNAMSAISNVMIIQSSTCANNIITGNQSTDAAAILDSGYSTDSTYLNNQNTIAPLTGSFTMDAANNKTILQGGVCAHAKVFLQPINAAAATLMSGPKSLYVTIAQPNFNVLTADATAAAGTEQFWYTIVQ